MRILGSSLGSLELEMESRVPVWPLRRSRVLACASPEEAAGKTQVPEESERPEDAEPKDHGEKSPPPPEHYLTHEDKHPGCEIRQQAKLTGRQCSKKSENPDRRNSDSLVASAKRFGDLITADHLNTHGQEDLEGSD